MDLSARAWARWTLAYDLLTVLVLLLFLQAFARDGVEVQWLASSKGPVRGLFLQFAKAESDPIWKSAEGDVLFSVTKYERPYLFLVGLLLVRMIGTWRLAPESFRHRYRTRWGRLKPRIALSVVMVLLLLAGAEAYLRHYYGRVGPTDARLVAKNEDGTIYRPGTEGKLFGVDVHINAMGFRGPEVPPKGEGPERRTRVLWIGDSFTMGMSLDEEDIFIRRTEAEIQAKGRRVDCINAAVGGYRTTDEVRDLELHFPKVEPDVVVLVFFMNDALPNWDMGRYVGKMYRSCKLFRLSYENWLNIVAPQHDPARVEECYRDGAPVWEEQWKALQRFRDLSVELGFRPLLVLHPFLQNLEDYPYQATREFLLAKFRALGVPFLDLTDTFAGRPDRELWLMPSDHHPNELASEIAAGVIAPWLEERLREE